MNQIILEDIEYIVSRNLNWDNLADSSVLITGANGLIASYMVETMIYLNDKKHLNINILALARNKDKTIQKFIHHKDRKDLNFVFQDVCDSINLTGLRNLSGFDTKQTTNNIEYIIHTASHASPKYFGSDPVGTLLPNTLGTINLLRLAQNNNLKSFLYISSSEVYGQLDDKYIPTKESDFGYLDPAKLRSCYSESKRMGENMCISWFHQFGVPVKIIRPFHTYGPGMDLNDGRVFADFASDIINNRNITMNSNGNTTRSFCYLADAIYGYYLVMLNGTNGEAYNVGNNVETQILDLANMLVNLFPEKKLSVIQKEIFRHEGYINSTVNRNVPDISKIQKLGWNPEIQVKEGFKRSILSYF